MTCNRRVLISLAVSMQVKNPWRTIFSRRYIPELMTALWIPIFQQLTGELALLFYLLPCKFAP